jgi:nucleotide-binding universal stress UspA family protein
VYKRILVGTDGSLTASRAVERAASLAASCGAGLTILSAGAPARARPIVEAAREAHAGLGVDITTEVVDGDPVTVLLDRMAEGGFDLLVVGNKGMTGASRFLLGSVPNRISHKVPLALLIVRTT